MVKIDVRKEEEKLMEVLQRVGIEFAGAMADRAPADTGELRSGIRQGWTVKKEGGLLVLEFNIPIQGLYQEFGTGLFTEFPGVAKKRITPKNAKALHFKPGVKNRGKYGKANPDGSYTFASVKGVHPQPFIRPAFNEDLGRILRKNLEAVFK